MVPSNTIQYHGIVDAVQSHPISSNPIPSHSIASHRQRYPIPSYPILPNPIQPYPIGFDPIPSFLCGQEASCLEASYVKAS